jgi:type II secretory pathway component PulK
MQHKNEKNTSKGIILITSLWIIAILTVFAVSVARQASILIRLASYDVDRQKAYFIAQAGIFRALSEKMLEYKTGMSTGIDALSQSWANNKELFLKREFGEGAYTLWHERPVSGPAPGSPEILYGLMDEQSKLNINIADESTLSNMLVYINADKDQAIEIAGSILSWRGVDSTIAFSSGRLSYGAENDYYKGLYPGYNRKNSNFDHIYELSLVRGITNEIMHKIEPYITVYGNGMININTASTPVLNALIGPAFPGLAQKIDDYRAGPDGVIGTKDDRWFSLGPVIINRERDGLVAIKNLQDAQWYANIYGITTEEYNRIRELATGLNPQLCVSSEVYRARVLAEVKKVKVELQAVYDFTGDKERPKIRFWYQE